MKATFFSAGEVSLDIAADGMGLGWTVKASVELLGGSRTEEISILVAPTVMAIY